MGQRKIWIWAGGAKGRGGGGGGKGVFRKFWSQVKDWLVPQHYGAALRHPTPAEVEGEGRAGK